MTLFRSPVLSTIQVVVSMVLALTPGVVRWWRERRLSPDDPALPERLVARQGEAVVTATCFLLIVMIGGRHAWWAVPLLVLARTAAAYPLRRRVFGETWSLPAYLAWTARLVIAIWGFWLVLIALPLLITRTGRWAVGVAILLGLVLAVWQRAYPRVLLRLLAARPMTPDTWPPGFTRVLEGARLAQAPGIWRAGPPGARIANAIALPSLDGPNVLFSETLLERLDDEERTAVLAHEVSHLELFTKALLRRWQWGTIATIAAGTALGIYLPGAPPVWQWAHAAWPLFVFFMLISRGRVIREQEAPSDRRAVELSGNAEAVVSGLVKLHETAKLPRRWALAHEQHATHPSLARRIQAIRQAAGQPAASVDFPIVIAGTDGTAVVFEADRVRHLAGVSGTNLDATALLSAASSAVSMPWAEVGELRVDASGGRSPRLLVADARGKEWTVALDPAGIAGVQATLDAVDGKLPSSLPVTAGAPRMARVAVGVVCAALLIAFQWTSALVVVALTLLKPNPQALIATGVATGAAALIAASQATSRARLLLDVLPVAAGAWVLWLAWRWHRAGGPADRLVHVLTGLAAIATWIAVLMYARLDPFLLHVVARRTHALVVLPLAMAAAWMWSAEPRFRRGAFAWLALAAIAVGVASTTWLNTIVRDPLLSRGPELQPVRARLVPVATSEVDLSASELWLSPGGRSFAVAPEPPEEDERPLPFTVGTTGGALAIVDAYAIRLVDEDTLVTLERDGEVLSIKARPVTATRETTWSVRITGEPWGDLSVDPATRRWRFEQPGDPGLRIFTGVIGSDRVEDRTVATDAPRIGYVQWFATDAAPIGHSHDYEQPTTMQTMATALLELPWRLPLALRFPNGGTVRSHFDGRCYGGRPGLAVTCVARDGTRSHFWMWDGHEWRPAGSIAGDYVPQDRDASGWLAGWSRGRLLLVDPLSAQALEIGGTCQGDECLTTATYTGRVLGGLMSSAGHVAVSTYRVEPLTPR